MCSVEIKLLDGQQFHSRCSSYINGLKPSHKKPIAKMVGDVFEYAPKDLGNIMLEYVRKPKFAKLKTKIDPVYNDVVAEVELNYEWHVGVRTLLVYFITERFAVHIRERSLQENTQLLGKGERDKR